MCMWAYITYIASRLSRDGYNKFENDPYSYHSDSGKFRNDPYSSYHSD